MSRKAKDSKGWLARDAFRLAAVALGLMVSAPGVMARANSAEPGHTITVGVANYARVPHGVLMKAEKEAKAVLHDAGVETTWLDCPLARYGAGPGPCDERTDAFLTIVTEVMKENRHWMQDTLGIALPCHRGGTACMAYIFYSRIETESADGYATASVILGHVMAHEMGHLLLGPGHSQQGIMRAEWSRTDLELASRHQLNFMPAQGESLRTAAIAPRQPVILGPR